MWLRGPIQLSDHLKTKYHKRKRNNNPHLAADDVILKGDLWDEVFFPVRETSCVPSLSSLAWHPETQQGNTQPPLLGGGAATPIALAESANLSQTASTTPSMLLSSQEDQSTGPEPRQEAQ